MEWLTREQAAERMQCSGRTISRVVGKMLEAGAPGIIKRGRNFLRINWPDLAEFMQKGR